MIRSATRSITRSSSTIGVCQHVRSIVMTTRVVGVSASRMPSSSSCVTSVPSIVSSSVTKSSVPVRHFAAPGAAKIGPDGLLAFPLADIGEGIAECEVIQWFVKVGDDIKEFDKVCKVQSDKATVDISSRYSGKITSLCYKQGEMAQVGAPLIILRPDPSSVPAGTATAAATSSPVAASSSSSSSGSRASSSSSSGERVLASPAVRRLAREHNIDIQQVTASGPKSNVTKEDVMKFMNGSAPPRAATSVAATPAPVSSTAAAPKAPKAAAPSWTAEDRVVPVTGIQRIMVQTMTAAASVPTLGYSDEIVMDALIKLRSDLKPLSDAHGVKLTYMPFLLKAASLSLLKFPSLNAHVNSDCSSVTWKGSHNIGFAMDTPRGLLVPNIKNVQNLSILDIGREFARLSALGAKGELGRDDLTGGTFTISNIGTIGGTYTRPILVVPEVVIAALGKFQVLPRFDEKMNVKATTIMVASLSADHRVVDGATIARFGNAWKGYLENPSTMILDTK